MAYDVTFNIKDAADNPLGSSPLIDEFGADIEAGVLDGVLIEGNDLIIPIVWWSSVVTNIYVDSHTGDRYNLTMTGSDAPRMLLTAPSDLGVLALKAKIEAMSVPTDWWGFGGGYILTDDQHGFMGPHRRGDSVLHSHWLRHSWDINSGTGWQSNYTSFPYQTAPFWIGVKLTSSTIHLYTSTDGQDWTQAHSRSHGSDINNLAHFGLMLHTLGNVPERTLELEVSGISFGDDGGFPA